MNQQVNAESVLRVLADKLSITLVELAIAQVRCEALEQQMASINSESCTGDK